MRRLMFLLLLLVVLVPTASALNVGDEKVVIPVVGRFPGASGTHWQTDVFLVNPFDVPMDVTLYFYPSNRVYPPAGSAEPLQHHLTIHSKGTATLRDICLNTFGLDNVGGQLLVESHNQFSINARARIYNTNEHGQFGQNVPGIGLSSLAAQNLMFGLSTKPGNRLNIGISNPRELIVPLLIQVRNANGGIIYERTLSLQPHQYVQFNDIATTFGIGEQEGLTVDVNSSTRFYAYASEVRTDTGDAVFTNGLSPNLNN